LDRFLLDTDLSYFSFEKKLAESVARKRGCYENDTALWRFADIGNAGWVY
jgi:hypothetical protein